MRLELSDITAEEGKVTGDIELRRFNSMFATRTDYVIHAWGLTRDPPSTSSTKSVQCCTVGTGKLQ